MTAIVLGLLAMHSSGAERVAAAELPVAASETSLPGHAGLPTAASVTTLVSFTAVMTAAQRDEVCTAGPMECALIVMVACTMLLAVAAFIVFAHRPGVYRRLLDAGGRVVAVLPRIPLQTLRPDLIVLSISRT